MFTEEKWQNRIRSRTDLSCFLTHLTKECEGRSSIQNLVKILRDRKINGSKGFIAGEDRAVCFQDAPIYSICQNTLHEQLYREELGGKVRYLPFGLAFHKRYVYSKKGRPVIYEKLDVAKQFISEDEWWRIVSLDLSNKDAIIDWTHEREWRVKGDFEFDLEDAYVLLVKNKTYKEFIKLAGHEIVKKVAGIIVLDPVLS